MTEPEPDYLMTDEQQTLVLAVVDAVNNATRPVTDEELARFLGEPLDDVAAVRRILELPNVVYQPGESPRIVLARILDVLEAFDEGEDYTPPPADLNDRY